MPRRSRADIETERIAGSPPPVLAPPASLSEAAKAIFVALVADCDADHFERSDLGLLCQYCEAQAMAERAAAAVGAGDSKQLLVWERAVRTMNGLALRLRLGPQSRRERRSRRSGRWTGRRISRDRKGGAVMVANDGPPLSVTRDRITDRALDLYAQMRRCQCTCDGPPPVGKGAQCEDCRRWRDLHAELHSELRMRPWEWPAIPTPRDGSAQRWGFVLEDMLTRALRDRPSLPPPVRSRRAIATLFCKRSRASFPAVARLVPASSIASSKMCSADFSIRPISPKRTAAGRVATAAKARTRIISIEYFIISVPRKALVTG
jgi:hypothetical protein